VVADGVVLVAVAALAVMLADAVDVGAPGKKFRRHSVPSRIARPI